MDLVVPTVQGREASLERCIESFKRLTVGYDLNPIVVPDSRTCGWGWKQGIAASRAPYIALVADDIECISDDWADICIDTVDRGFLPCPRVYRPDGTIESQGGDMHAYGHILSRHTKDGAKVDFTTVPFGSRDQLAAIGMTDVQYACDLYVSRRGRQLGFETVLRHGYDLIHYQHPAGRGAGMSQNERDAMDCETVLQELERLESEAHVNAPAAP